MKKVGRRNGKRLRESCDVEGASDGDPCAAWRRGAGAFFSRRWAPRRRDDWVPRCSQLLCMGRAPGHRPSSRRGARRGKRRWNASRGQLASEKDPGDHHDCAMTGRPSLVNDRHVPLLVLRRLTCHSCQCVTLE